MSILQNSMSIKNFVPCRPYLVLSTNNCYALSEDAVLESVFNYGYFKDAQMLFSLLGIKKTARIFKEQIRRKRVNYSPKIRNYFTLYFKKYA